MNFRLNPHAGGGSVRGKKKQVFEQRSPGPKPRGTSVSELGGKVSVILPDEAAGRRCLGGLQVLIKQLTGVDQLSDKC